MPESAFTALEKDMYGLDVKGDAKSGHSQYAQNPIIEAAKKSYYGMYTSFLRLALPYVRKAAYGAGWLTDSVGERLDMYGSCLEECGGKRAKIGRGMREFGRTFKYLFGTEMLERTSVEFGLAFVLSPPGVLRAAANVTAGGTLWSGDLNYYRKNGGIPSDYHRYLYGGVNLPFFTASHTTFGSGTGWNPPYVSFFADPRMDLGTIGLTNFAAIHFGKVGANDPSQYGRGYFLGTSFGVGIIAVNAYLYYPPLEHIIKRVGLEKAAEWQRKNINDPVQDYTSRIKAWTSRAFPSFLGNDANFRWGYRRSIL